LISAAWSRQRPRVAVTTVTAAEATGLLLVFIQGRNKRRFGFAAQSDYIWAFG
jgi:hypothetical protein